MSERAPPGGQIDILEHSKSPSVVFPSADKSPKKSGDLEVIGSPQLAGLHPLSPVVSISAAKAPV